jgi:signal transduction histidine kinase
MSRREEAKLNLSRRARFAAVIFLIWTAVGLFQAVPGLLRGFHWPEFIAKIAEAWTWVLLTPWLLWIDGRLAAMEQKVNRLILFSLLLSVPFSLVHTYLLGLLLYPMKAMWWNPLRDAEFGIYYFVSNWLTYIAALGILQALRYHHRLINSRLELEQLDRRLVETRLDMLRTQLEPHFLFNALNTISCQIPVHPKLAQEMVEDVGVLLRRSIDTKERHKIPLSEELSLLEHYIAIQRVRFGKRIDIQVEVAPAALRIEVPPMLLQPLVENAVRHGIEGRVSGGRVIVSGELARKGLRIRVIDDGIGLPERWRLEESTGVGLRVTRERLETLYRGVAGAYLLVRPRKGGGTEAEILIPIISGEEDNHAGQ